MSLRHTRLAAALAAAWAAEVEQSRRLQVLGDMLVKEPRTRARLNVMSAFCRAHAARLLSRLAALGRGPLPVPAEVGDLGPDPQAIMRADSQFAEVLAKRYEEIAALARQSGDMSSAWVCDLNRTEAQDLSRELRAMSEFTPSQQQALL